MVLWCVLFGLGMMSCVLDCSMALYLLSVDVCCVLLLCDVVLCVVCGCVFGFI